MAKIVIGSSEISRRAMLASAAGVGSISLLALTSPAWAKMSQGSVAYQDTPKGDRTCVGCGLFQGPSSCKIVDGAISPNGWCKYWVKKAS